MGEIRWRSGSSAISSSWWFHQNAGGAWTEIDVFETTGSDAQHGSAKAIDLPSHVHIFDLPNATIKDLPSKCHCANHGSAGLTKPCSVGAYYQLAEGDSFAKNFHVASLNWTDTGV